MINQNYLTSIIRQFKLYQSLGEKAMAQVADEKLNWQMNDDSNSIAIIVKHLWGNMLSRWTDFLTTDGEKEWRQRDAEFETGELNREQILQQWNEGWNCLFATLNTLQPDDLERIIYIRNEGHTVMEAINRQLCHYSYHVGQIVLLAKMCSQSEWQTLSIAKGKSTDFNTEKFSKEKSKV